MKKYLTQFITTLILIILIVTTSIVFRNKTEHLKVNSGIKTKDEIQLSEKEKVDDFEYMFNILKDNYPYFEVNKRQHKVDWLSYKSDYLSRIKVTNSDLSYYNTLKKILSDLNNGHTYMVDKNNYLEDKRIYELDPKNNAAWLNQLNKTNVLERYSKLGDENTDIVSSSNNDKVENVSTKIIKNNEIAYLAFKSFNTFNIDNDMKIVKPFLTSLKKYKAIIFDIRGNTGGDTRYWTDNIIPMLISKPLYSTEYLAYRGGTFTEDFLKCRTGNGYDKLNLIMNLNRDQIRKAPTELENEFEYYIKNDIEIDPKESINFSGKNFIVTDGFNFSSADEFANFAKNSGLATIVGQTTGGDGIGDGPAVCALPNSGFIFSFSKQMGLTQDGTCNFEYGTEPNIKVSTNKGKNISEDEAVQEIIKLVK